MTIRKLLVASVLFALAFSFACDLNKTTAQATAKTVMVATLLHVPAVDVRAEAIAGFDASFPTNDSGFTFDAGGLTFDAGFTIPPQTAAFSFFGTRNGDGLSQAAPTPIVGATMTVQEKGGAEHALKDLGGGTFQLTTQDDATLGYDSAGTYSYTAKANGETFIAIVENVPPQETIPQFHPAGSSFISLAARSDFSFRRPDAPSGQERALGFVLVFAIDRDGKQGAQTYTNVPKTPLEFLKLVVAPTDWRTTIVLVPGSAFPDPDKNYIILLQSAKLGRPDTDNLFIGSAILAGTADVGIVKTY